ncbi:MAG: general stress protein [Planctomyces sp.]|nr:general stress protein [Planctomyces sp.]
MAATQTQKLHDLLSDFQVAMLVTRTADGELRSRPMAVAQVEAEGTLWFFTQRQSGKVDEIGDDHHVNVAMQSSSKFVSLTCTSQPVNDRAKVQELWNESWKTWFPKGPHDPSLTLLRVDATAGEYWDNSGTSGLKYLIKAGQAYLAGETPDVSNDPTIHGKVKL